MAVLETYKLFKINLKIRTYLALHAVFSTLLHYRFGRNTFWPGIDVLAPAQQNYVNPKYGSTSDLFVDSSLQISGRTPYITFVSALDFLLPSDSVAAISILSGFTVCFASSLLILAFYSSSIKRSLSRLTLVPLTMVILSLVPIFSYPYWSEISSIYVAGYGPFIFSWTTPEFFAIMVASGAISLLNVSKNDPSKVFKILIVFLLSFSLIIHPSSILFLLLLIITFKAILKTLELLDVKVILLTILVSSSVLVPMFLVQSDLLSSREFVQIYANFRHPHHFLVSQYLSLQSIGIYLMLMLFTIILTRKSPRLSLLIAIICLYSIVFNLVQYLSTEIYPQKTIAAFGPSRINVYILTSLYLVLVIYLSNRNHIKQNNLQESHVCKEKGTGIWSSALVLLMIGTSVIASGLSVKSDYDNLRLQTKDKMIALDLQPGDLILPNPFVINTLGWREFGGVSIWLDRYFNFNLNGVTEYRKRWLDICGEVDLTLCDLSELSNESLFEYMINNSINKLVVDQPLLVDEAGAKFSLVGQYGDLRTYEILIRKS